MNLLREFMDDELYETLNRLGILNHKAVRDYYIRKKFKQLKNKQKPGKIMEKLREEFPYLSIETIKKIVYSKPKDSNLI